MQHIVIDPAGALPSALQAFIVPDDRRAISLAIDALIQRLDETEGDSDAEDDGTAEPDGCELDCAWAEWDSLSHAGRCAALFHAGEEDDENADGGGDCTDDEPGFDRTARLTANALGFIMGHRGAGCPISDPDHEHDGREEEAGVLHPRYGSDQTKLLGGL